MPEDQRPDRAARSVRLRPATEGDISLLIAIETDAGELFRTVGLDAIADEEPDDPDTLRAHVHDGTAWVAESGGEVVGYAIASIVGGHAHLDQVSVIRAAQGSGIGRALIEQVERWGRDQGLGAVSLTTFTDVPWNGPYYARLGYEEVPTGEITSGLAAIRASEKANGLDLLPRIAMHKALTFDDSAT